MTFLSGKFRSALPVVVGGLAALSIYIILGGMGGSSITGGLMLSLALISNALFAGPNYRIKRPHCILALLVTASALVIFTASGLAGYAWGIPFAFTQVENTNEFINILVFVRQVCLGISIGSSMFASFGFIHRVIPVRSVPEIKP